MVQKPNSTELKKQKKSRKMSLLQRFQPANWETQGYGSSEF